MATFKVKLLDRFNRIDLTVKVEDTEYILDAAENQNIKLPYINLPYSCRAGACSTCAGKLIVGKVDQSDQSYLCESHLEEGYMYYFA